MKIGCFWGIPIKIHWSMLLLTGIYSCLGLAVPVLFVLTSVLLHEFAHALAARIGNLRVAEVQLFPFGGQAQLEDFTAVYPCKEIAIALAGPVASGLLAGICTYLFSEESSPECRCFIRINWLLCGFNLLPVLPLDGGRVLRAILGSLWGYRRATRLTAGLGQLLGVLLWGWNWVQGLQPNLFLLSIVLFWTACREQRFFSYGFLRYLLHQKGNLYQKGLLPVKVLSCTESMRVRNILEELRPQYYLLIAIVNETQQMTGFRSEGQLIEAFLEKGLQIRLQDVEAAK